MRKETQLHKKRRYATVFLKELAENGITIFTTSDAKQIAVQAGIPEAYIVYLLMRLVRDGWITRLKRGVYIRAGSVLGNAAIHPFVIATNIVVPSAISHWSALHYHGLTEQVPYVVTAFTPKKVVTPSMRRGSYSDKNKRHAWVIDGVRYEYITVKEKYFFGMEKIWVDEISRVLITDKERTVLEVFASPWMFGGIGEALSIIEKHLNVLSIDKLVNYACRYGRISVAKRLGWILERVGVSESLLVPLLEMPAAGYHVLDPRRPRRGVCDKRWMLQINIGEVVE